MLRESEFPETPSVSNTAQASENARKNSFLNYKSAALPAELCRRRKTSQSGAGCCPRQANFFGILRVARAADTAAPAEISIATN
jgi:hypothetical protein